MEDDPAFQDQVKELEQLDILMAIGEKYLESSLESYICQIDKANGLAGTSKISALLINYQRMVGIAKALVKAE